MRVLILGGTSDARLLATALSGPPADLKVITEVITSLAGRVADPLLPPGQVRIGDFEDTDALVAYLRRQRITAVVDATHPFAERISALAVTACTRSGLPLLILHRPGWTATEGDHWLRVTSIMAAATTTAASPPGRVLLTIGRRGLERFAADADHEYLIRSVEPPRGPLPPRHRLILARGPFDLDAEREVLRGQEIGLLVTKDSGGAMTAAKLAAARELGVPVLMVNRPNPAAGVPVVATLEATIAWLSDQASHVSDRASPLSDRASYASDSE